MTNGFRIGRIAGFPLSLDWSVFVVAGVLAWGLAGDALPAGAPGHSATAYWLAGLIAAALFFASLLAHELAHALAARRAGVEVKQLALWLFGGVASLGGEPATPRADVRIAAVGPATSLGLAAGFAAAAAALDALGIPHMAVSVAGWLAGTNLLLGLFNLLPGAPLDGGRILRGCLWARRGDRARAATGAARAGCVIGYGLIGVGLLQTLSGAGGGLWLALVGWFVLSAARGEEAAAVAREALDGVRVGDVMTPHPVTAPGWGTVDAFIERHALAERHSAYPVEGFDGRVAGLVTLAELRAVPAGERHRTRVADVAVPLADVPVAEPADGLVELLGRDSHATGGRSMVLDEGRLVGIVTPADVARAIELGQLRARPRQAASAR